MAVDIRLKKPQYGWIVLGHGEGNQLQLSNEVEDWLVDRGIHHDCYTKVKLEEDGKTYLYFYIKIHDDNAAMLFKLTWL